jgi:hypothetical protein
LLIQITAEQVQTLGPEFFILRKPRGRVLHRLRQEPALHYAPIFRAANQPSVLEHTQMFHEASQRHAMRRCEFRNRQTTFAQGFQHCSARGIGKRSKDGIEVTMLMLNHKVQYGGKENIVSRQGTLDSGIDRDV